LSEYKKFYLSHKKKQKRRVYCIASCCLFF